MPDKRALIVALNDYASPGMKLRGCVNDALSLANVLTSIYKFSSDDIVMLKDSSATRNGILDELRNLVGMLKEGDTFVFGHDGHGTQWTVAGDTDVVEAVVPYETTPDSLISNKDINSIIRDKIKSDNLSGKVAATVIIDACHTGFMFRD